MMAVLKKQWIIKNGKARCYGGKGTCSVTTLWEAKELTAFHDAELARATKEINAILNQLERSNKDPERTLSFIQFQNRHFLIWATYGSVGPYHDDKTIIKALGLKVR